MCIGQEAYIRKYYLNLNREIRSQLTDTRPRNPDDVLPTFIGGYFYWYFVHDMTGQDKSGRTINQERNRKVLKEAMVAPASK